MASPRSDGKVARFSAAAGPAAIAAFVVAVVGMMIVPLPTWLLDILISLNLALSVTLLLGAVYARDALSIATFPTLLVLTTLYRLGLNVSTTRLILLQADAGHVVKAFGSFVVRGDYVVGFAVFLILTIVQYIVIARGAERVAEVAARFTLDAMPGRQLAIDGDLRSGAIDAEEARRRRRALGREAQVYGALDGAMRFVKGDAIAGILILVISLVGGLIVGVLQRSMPVADAAKLYTLLTIGDGLVSQMPALLISTAAGLVVTRVASEDDGAEGSTLGADMARQLLGRPQTLLVVAGLLVVLALVPGLPLVPFVVVAIPFALGALVALRRKPTSADTPALEPAAHAPVEVALDPALAAACGELDLDFDQAARAVVEELGIPLAKVAQSVDASLPPRGYEVRLRGVPMADGVLPDGKLLANATSTRLTSLGVDAQETPHPASGAPASWVAASAAPAVEAAGVNLLDTRGCLVAALDGTLRRFAHELIGFDETQRLVDGLSRSHPALVREVVPRRIDVATLTDVLRRLVAEGVPVRDLRDILEALATVDPATSAAERSGALLTERVRASLKRHITHHLARDRRLEALVLDPVVEEALREAIRPTRGGAVLALEPAIADDILRAIERALETAAPLLTGARRAVIITSSELRRHVRRLVEGEHPELSVITAQELNADVRVEPVGRVSV